MGQAVSREVLGAWLLKGNPAVWDVRRFLADGHSVVTSWSVRPGYRSAVAELRAAGITDLEVQRVPQGSNPSWVSRTQLAALVPLLPSWPTPPAR